MMKPLDIIPHQDCTGCESCAASCGISCISMQQDKRGFFYPWVDNDRCVNCGACSRACPVLNVKKLGRVDEIYACRANSEEILQNSSSGGVFTMLANNIIAAGGSVCGASFNSRQEVHHETVDSEAGLIRLRGSKYVQSRTAQALKDVKRLSRNGHTVLFTGTPCQCAGARSLVGKSGNDNLICMEVVCHGVPSPGVFDRYISEMEQKFKSKIVGINFRDKSAGWKSYRLTIRLENGNTISVDGRKDPYVSGFIDNLFLRESCTTCRFKHSHSQADFTVGDFWGVEDLKKDCYNDNKGVPLLCVNTRLGKELFCRIKDKLADITPTDLASASKKNPCLIEPTSYNPRTRRFYRSLQAHTVEESVIRAQRYTFFDKVKISMKYRLGRLFYAKS